VQTVCSYLLQGPSYTALKSPLAVMQNFQLLNGCCGNKGRYGVNLDDTIRLPDPKNRGVGKHSVQLSFTGTELCRFEVPIGCNAKVQIFL